MQFFKSYIMVVALMLSALLPSSVAWAATEPAALVKKTSDDVLAIVKNDKEIQAGDKKKLYALAEEKILPNFDFNRVCRLVLGKHWRRANDAQKQSFLKEFRTLLLRTYSIALVKYEIKSIVYKKTKYSKDKNLAKVPTEIVPATGGPNVGVTYTLKSTQDTWKVYDIVIENISLVTNYRSQFGTEIRQNGLDSLIAKLVKKNQSAVGK